MKFIYFIKSLNHYNTFFPKQIEYHNLLHSFLMLTHKIERLNYNFIVSLIRQCIFSLFSLDYQHRPFHKQWLNILKLFCNFFISDFQYLKSIYSLSLSKIQILPFQQLFHNNILPTFFFLYHLFYYKFIIFILFMYN